MLETYREALEAEASAWNALGDVARRQRQAIIYRQVDEVDELRRELEEQLRRTLLAHHQSQQSQPEQAEAIEIEWEQRVRRTQFEARHGLRLNRELLRDTCNYLEMLHALTERDSGPVAYGPAHARRQLPASAQSKVA
ncbi:MAG: hypothetical protein ACYC63_18025 [Armatimonadota bacterium]